MSELEGSKAYEKFGVPETAHSAVLHEASVNRPWTPEIVNSPRVEIEEDVYAEGILQTDPREKQDRHDLLLDGRLDRYRKNIEEGRNRWDLVLVEQDFYQHPDEFEVSEEFQHNRNPEDELRKGDADLLFLDLDEHDIHMVEVKPHDGYAEKGKMQKTRSENSWQEPRDPDYEGLSEPEGSLERPRLYDYVAENYPGASQEDAEDLVESYSGFDEEVIFSVLSQMSDFEWSDAETEMQRVAQKDQIPIQYHPDSESFSQHARRNSPESSGEDENLSNADKKTQNLNEAWKTVAGELENDWTVYHPEFVFGSDVLDASELSNNPEYALPHSYDRSTGYALGTVSGFEKAESSSDLENLNETFFRGEITELLEGERPEMERKSVV